jgi:hypothetical protein
LIQTIVPSAEEVVTQGDVHEEIDLLRYLNVEDLKIGTLLPALVSTRFLLLGVRALDDEA